MRALSAFLAIAVGLTAAWGAQATNSAVSDPIAKAVADPSRPSAQVATDVDRKPAETLAFAGIRPGMVVGEFFPGGGYFTQLLSHVVGPRGHVYGLENAGWKGAVKADEALLVAQQLANVTVVALPFGSVSFPKPLDVAWISQNYHDLKVTAFGDVDTAAFNRAVFSVLKPGGIYFILDHQAAPGTDPASIATLHRIEKAQVIREVTAAGFVLVAEDSFLSHPQDDLTVPIFDQNVQGHTDQYALRFMKPS